MFNLNKSLAKLKSTLQATNLASEKQAASENSDPNKSEVKETPKKKKTNRPKKVTANNGAGAKQKRGVLMIKNFPHGFYEKQMFDYFSQFGEVTRLKIARSRKTGNPRSYGFIEFQFEDVAKIAAETMNNYIMFDHIVKCSLLPPEKVPKNLFLNWNRPFISSVKTHKVAHNQDKTKDNEYNLLRKRLKRIHNMEKTLQEKGLDFKCVVVNRPTNLNKAVNKTVVDKSKGDIVKLSIPKMMHKTSRRRLVLPKFMVVKAGFNYKC